MSEGTTHNGSQSQTVSTPSSQGSQPSRAGETGTRNGQNAAAVPKGASRNASNGSVLDDGSQSSSSQRGGNASAGSGSSGKMPSGVEGDKKGAEIQSTDDPFIWTLKVRGEDRKYDIRDPKQADVVRRYAQKAEGADKTFEEASREGKKARSFFEALKSNPRGVLEAMGHNVSDLAKAVIAEEMKMRAMTPEQKAIWERDQQLEQYRTKEAQEKAEREASTREKLMQDTRTKWDQNISEALQGSGLPKTAYTVARTAQYVAAAREKGYKDITASDVMDTVRKDYVNDIREMLGNASMEQVEELAGKDFLKRIREHDIKKLQNPSQAEFAKKPDYQPSNRKPTQKKSYTWAEYQKVLEERARS